MTSARFRTTISASVSLVVLTFAIPVFGQAGTNPDLDRMRREFAAAFNDKDPARVASFYAEDGWLMLHDLPVVAGRSAIQAEYKRQFEARISSLELQPLESETKDALGFDAGTYAMKILLGVPVPTGIWRFSPVGAGTLSLSITGKYVSILKRVGNDWRIAYHIQSSDQPLPR